MSVPISRWKKTATFVVMFASRRVTIVCENPSFLTLRLAQHIINTIEDFKNYLSMQSILSSTMSKRYLGYSFMYSSISYEDMIL